jgi:hypothetical protein
MPVLVIAYEFQIVCGIHLPRPDDFGAVDVRGIVDPLIPRFVLGRISHEYELFAGELFQFGLNPGSLRAEITWAPPPANPSAQWQSGRSEMERLPI